MNAKKLHSLFSLCVIIFSTNIVCAQQIPNSNFNTSFENALHSGTQPPGWKASNVSQMGVDGVFIKPAAGAGNDGSLCVRMENLWVGALGIGANAPAYMALGQPWSYISGTNLSSASGGTDGGLAFTYRPDSLEVWVKRTYSSTETAHALVYLWNGTFHGQTYKNKGGGCGGDAHTNEESDIRGTNTCTSTPGTASLIGQGEWTSSAQIPNWTLVKAPITYQNNLVPQYINVILSSADYPNGRDASKVQAGSILYVDNFKLIYSSKIHELYIANKKWGTFNSDTKEYTYALGVGATEIPTIEARRSGRVLSGSEITITNGTVGGAPTTITVRAEDGSSTTTYTINFVAQQSTNCMPSGISVGGTAIANFSGYVTSYNVELPYGTTAVPAITVVKAEDGQTYAITPCANLPGAATVTIYAEDASISKTYTINLTVAALTDNTLQEILINGKSIAGFSPTKTTYTVEMPLGTTTDPTITPISAYAAGEQVIVLTNNGLSGKSTITVTPKGGTNTRTYNISYKITASTYSYLSNISVGGTPLTYFVPETLNYSYTLPIGTTTLPAIVATPGDDYQTITKEENGVDGVTKITVTAASGAVSIYRITFSTLKSNISTLGDLTVGGTTISGFDSNTFDYTYTLPIGTTTLPAIAWTAGDTYQTILKTDGGINGTTRIVVRAQDGTTNTYAITFSVSQATVSTLLDLRVGGVTITDFAPETLSYTYVLPRGTVSLPEINYTPYDAYQTIRKVEGGVNGETKITVKSQSGSQSIYTITFSVEKSADATLSTIKIGGIALAGFRADSLNYTYELPSGTIALPLIESVKNDDYQTIYTTKGGVDGTTYLRVIAENGAEQTYSITFSVLKSENAFLKNILIDGASLVGFDPNTFAYTYILSESATVCPTITVVKEEGQSVTITSPKLVGTARIEVIPEEGASNIYTIKFTYVQSTNKQLNDLQVNGTTLTGFSGTTLDYTYELANGTTTLPTITFTKGDALQTVLVNPSDVNGTTTIIVKAENGEINTYSIAFTVTKSNDTTLQSLKVGGVELAGFDANVLTYNYTLATGTKTCPEITAIGNHPAQDIRINSPFVNGIATITVTAENGDSQVYTINLAFEPLTNTTLANITINGTPLATFNPSVLTYTIDLPSDATAPLIDFVATDTTQTIALTNNGLNGTQILVVAENGDQQLYTLTYNIAKNTNALLADLQLYNGSQFVSLSTFAPTTFNYIDSLAWRAVTVPVINPVLAHKGQVITIAYSGINHTTRIHVVAEDGVTSQDYTIEFPVKQSSVCNLNDIAVENGQFSPSFDPEINFYTVTLPYGTTKVPTISWLLGEDDGKTVTEQRIELTAPNLRDTTLLTVTAENGNTKEYKLVFTVTSSTNTNVLNGILVDGVGYFDLTSTSETSFDVALPYGTTVMPNIVCTKSYEEQTVVIDKGTVNSQTIITVKANKDNLTDKVYTLNTQVAKLPTAVLSDIKINGTSITGFNPGKRNYVVAVTDVPTIEFVAVSGADASNRTIENTKQIQVEVAATDVNDTYTTTYNVFFYYTNDVIPNSEFNSWGTAKYNSGAKPTGWQVPADGAEKYSVTATYTTGPEVNKATSGSENSVRLRTWSSHYSIYGSIPGLMTLGNLNLTLAASNGSTMSISGGIPFRNTPESVLMDYKPVSKTGNVNNMKFTYTLSDGTTTVNKTFTDASFNNTLKTMTLDVKSAITIPTTMNIIVNSAHSENPQDISYTSAGVNFWAGMKQESDMYVDKLRFQYSSKVNSILINGSAVSGFDGNVPSNTVTVDADFQGLPYVTPIGEVADQEYTITIDALENSAGPTKKSRYVELKSKAEDGTITTYNLYIQRLLSTNKALAGLSVNGTALSDFNAATYTYNVTVANGTTLTPDITALRGSEHQTISFVTDGVKPAIVRVTAEDGTTQDYTINFVEEKSANVTLQNIVIETNPADFTFEDSEYGYLVTLPYGSTLPAVNFEKVSDGQTVIVKTAETTTLKVIAENGIDEATYAINFVNSSAPTTSGQLIAIAANGVGLTAFDKGTYIYTQTKDNTEPIQTLFVREATTDSVAQIITNDSIMWNVIGSSTNNYILKFDEILSSNVDLATILIDKDTLATFNSAILEYTINTNKSVSVEALCSEIGQQLTMTYTSGTVEPTKGIFAFTVTSTDNSKTQKTEIILNDVLSTNSSLNAIKLDGEIIRTAGTTYVSDNDFATSTLVYNITLPCANPKVIEPSMPHITVQAGAIGQTIVIEQNGVNATSFITVTAEDGTSESVYELAIASEKSSNATLTNIAVNYVSVDAFAAINNTYEVTLPNGSDLPIISYSSDDKFQKVETTITMDSAILVVTAEDGTINRYVVTFNINRSNDASLGGILIDGTPLDGFRNDSTNYTLTLPVGTTSLPEISAISGATGQTINIVNEDIDGTTTITVTAEDGTTSIYTIVFDVQLSQDNLLNMIYLNGDSLAEFVATTQSYNMTLPVGTRTLPIITWDKGFKQTAEGNTTLASTYNYVYEIDVTAEDPTFTSKYTLTFSVLKSEVDTLKDLTVNGETLALVNNDFTSDLEFESNQLRYHLTWPVGSTTLPVINWIAGDTLQHVELTETAATLNDSIVITVTAEDGIHSKTYIIYNQLLLSTVDTLQTILIDGLPLVNFEADTLTYDYVLPYGTTTLPTINWEAGDSYQQVDTLSHGVNGTFTLTVTAQNGDFTTYTINFSVEKSHNALLNDLLVNNTSLVGFDGEVFNYLVKLPYGTTELPTITYLKGEESQGIEQTDAITLNDTTYIKVTAEDGTTTNKYAIYYDVLLSNNALLQTISIGGELISKDAIGFTTTDNFDPESFEYTIGLPFGTTTLPTITWEGQVADYNSISIETNGISGTSIITVVSQDESNSNTYNLTFNVAKSSNNKLADLLVNEITIDGFNPDTLNYTIVYPIGTDSATLITAAAITYIAGDMAQTVVVSQLEPTVILVTVTAENGATQVYVIQLEIALSNNSLLQDIKLDGVSLKDFESTIFEYTFLLFNGRTIPEIEAVKSEESQTTQITINPVGEITYIFVTAEDGSESVYTINFKYSNENPGDVPTKDDVYWMPLGNGAFKASTSRNNVKVALFDPSGRLITMRDVPVADPNDDIKDEGSMGTIFHFNKVGKVFIYVFYCNDKNIVTQGKFIY